MEQIKKFTFGKDFGKNPLKKNLEIIGSKIAEPQDALPRETVKVLTNADIEKAEAIGFEKGKVSGLTEGKTLFYEQGFAQGRRKAQEESKQSIEAETLKIVEKVQSSLAVHIKERQVQQQNLKDASIDVAIKIAKKAFPLYETNFGYDELRRQVERVLVQLVDEEAITVEVSATLTEAQVSHLRRMFEAEGLADKTKIHQRQELRASDVVLKWQGGMLERKVDRIVSAMEKLAKSE